MSVHLAIDLGAGSGRVELGVATRDGIRLEELHRFTYAPRESHGHLRWDVARLFDGIRTGLTAAGVRARQLKLEIASIGVDSWGVDYGLVDDEGRLVEEPVTYRDHRTGPEVVEEVLARVPRDELFARTGIQILPINTLFQLAAHVREGIPPHAARLLMIPDLCHHLLCGSMVAEYTNASTTQLLDGTTRDWNDDLFRRLGLPRHLMPPIVTAGTTLGALTPELGRATGLGAVPVVAPATHDTGSAVVGTPLEPGGAFISSGTWSLVGVERVGPVLGGHAAAANVTNEGGAFGTVRVLKNVMGLWIFESCRREWGSAAPALAQLLEGAAAAEGVHGTFAPDDLRFLNPPGMLGAIEEALVERGHVMPRQPAGVARVVLDSLAARYAEVIGVVERLTGDPIRTIHVVGGGSLNTYLNQATANATGRPVLAGPAEATAIGNVMAQAIAAGTYASLGEAREALRHSVSPVRYEPE